MGERSTAASDAGQGVSHRVLWVMSDSSLVRAAYHEMSF